MYAPRAEGSVRWCAKRAVFCLTVVALLLPAVAVAQAPSSTKTPVAPQTEQIDPKCAESGVQITVGKGGEMDTQRQDGKENSRAPAV
jgi:hypothetical protein